MAKYENKTSKILSYLETGAELSTMDGIKKFNTTTIAKAIMDLKNQGHNIITEMRRNEKTGTQYGVYKLVDSNINEITEELRIAKQLKAKGKKEDAKKQVDKVLNKIYSIYC